ncbi:hypothetical protein Taro_020942 [Colocasia esculenta]|uniref:Uncharacterized protein n=1 Tax=Colocasia esculenta TaxID=4460 RepID=A0A843V030_COLES|nr:hypothetical protein [Colocasia esculenta]
MHVSRSEALGSVIIQQDKSVCPEIEKAIFDPPWILLPKHKLATSETSLHKILPILPKYMHVQVYINRGQNIPMITNGPPQKMIKHFGMKAASLPLWVRSLRSWIIEIPAKSNQAKVGSLCPIELGLRVQAPGHHHHCRFVSLHHCKSNRRCAHHFPSFRLSLQPRPCSLALPAMPSRSFIYRPIATAPSQLSSQSP